ncbi:S1C family serine protease [Bremerella sp. P1]|uniref:S1C family serine protease n=1 Tax=Bremerella sp. P1 TaxID=3026424 RepID=UPI002367FB66|nr:serine protease [Bremerella sp. P1]WDI41021.1 serine protease [Bremerella sp. P1]
MLLRGAVGSGTAFVVGDQLLVTNSHVVAVAALNPATGEFKDLRAYSPAASTERRGPYRVSLLYEDPDWDLAVLRILDRVDFRPVAMAKNYQFQRGEAITIIGNPGLFNGVETLETAVSTGILSTTHPLQGREHYQLGAAVNGGNSGGPVFGEAGQVIGVIVSKSLSEDEISFCIPVREAIRATATARSISARSQQLMWKEHESRVPKAIANLAVPSGSIVTIAHPPWSFVFIAVRPTISSRLPNTLTRAIRSACSR